MDCFVLIDVDCGIDEALLERVAEACTIQGTRDASKPAPFGWDAPFQMRAGRDPHDILPGEWPCLLLSAPDVDGALAYHDKAPNGRPLVKLFPKLLDDVTRDLTGVASHEAIEAAANPELNRVSVGLDNLLRCAEPADPVETYSYPVTLASGAVELVSAFVTPAFFEPPDDLTGVPLAVGLPTGKAIAPGQILDGGYQIFFDPDSKQWTQQTGHGSMSAYRQRLSALGWGKLPRIRTAHGFAP